MGDAVRVGADIGGTFTDLAFLTAGGSVFREKAFTTPGDWAQGILDGLGSAAERHFACTLPELLPRVVEFTHGTTIVTNVLAQMNGLRVGLVTTGGFGDTLRIARSARQNTLDLQVQESPPQIVAPTDILELDERIDRSGDVVVPLDADAAKAGIDRLVEDKVEALAVSLLWSFENPEHERTIRAIVERDHPQLPVFLSSDVHPVIREYERTVTTVLNAYVSRGVKEYLQGLQQRLDERGLRVPVGVMQCTGGITSIEDALAAPLLLLASGPVGGVIAARELAQRLSIPRMICADMGGTSFDTALIENGRVGSTNRAQVERLKTGLTLVDVVSIGTGGGSIAHLDSSGRPSLGPHSAGAVPGPVAYGRGGTRPTTTDIAVALNLLAPEGFLDGRVELDVAAAGQAIEASFSSALGMDLHDVCRGYFRIGFAAMAQAVRSVTVERGQDPHRFALVSYGGASGLFIAEIAAQLGIRKIVVPEAASVFSAFGMLCGDVSRTNSKTINWNVLNGDIEILGATQEALEASARERLGGDADGTVVAWEADLKFGTQAYELTFALEALDSSSDSVRRLLIDRFRDAYEARHGKGTHWQGAEGLITLVNLRVTVARPVASVEQQHRQPGAKSARGSKTRRTVYWPVQEDVPVIPVDSLDAKPIPGPLIVEAGDTTVYVPRKWQATCDSWNNIHLDHGAS